jgi:multidrug efflux pump subunit AcrA (membrane-fusion protein)
MKTKIVFLAMGIMLAAISFFACSENTQAVEPEVPVFSVSTDLAERGQLQDFIGLSGDVIASSMVDAFSEAAGRVQQILVTVGQQVRRGQAMATVDPSRAGMDFQPHTVTAPVAGTVVAIPAQIGMTVSQAVPLVRIAAGNTLEIRLFVAERFISRMALGLTAEISLAAWPGEVFAGRITELSPTIDPVSRTMEIRVRVENPGNRLKAGMFANVRLITQSRNDVIKVPASAVVSRMGGQYVFIVAPDPDNSTFSIAQRRTVVTGISTEGITEIQSGIEADDEVIVRGQSLLEDGVRINVVERAQGAQSGEETQAGAN